MVRRAGNLLDYDLIDAGNDFVDFYNGFMEAVAEEALGLVNKGELQDISSARQILKAFTINMSELRGRGNTLMKKMRQQGYPISGMELKPFNQDLEMEMTSPPEALPDESGTDPLKA